MSEDLEFVNPVRGRYIGPRNKDFNPETLDKNIQRALKAIEDYLSDLRISSAKITDLEVSKLTGGSIDVTIVLSGLIQAPAATGYRVEIGDASFPLRYWNGTTTKFSLDSSGNLLLTGTIQNSAGNPIIRPTGFPRAKVTQTNAQTFADATPEVLDWSAGTGITTVADTDSFVDEAGSKFEIAFTGQYDVRAQIRWEQNADVTSRRLRVTRNGVNIDELIDTRKAISDAATTTSNVSAIVDFGAGDNVQLEGTQWSGGNLDINDWSAQLVYLGDA
jgi:hypothetical protein